MKTILVLDDENSLRRLVCRVLSRLLSDCTVLDAPDGQQGVAILKQRPVDLIVSDLKMPALDGFGVAEVVKRLDPAIPLYITSGCCDPESRQRLSRLGVSRYFEKPFSFDMLADAAAQDLGLQRQAV